MCLCVCFINVCRWVKWTSTDIYSDHSLMSACLVTCLWLMMTTCWSRTTTRIAYCCLTLNYSYNASSLTLNSSCGVQHDYVTVQTRHCCVLCTAVGRHRRVTWSRCSVCAEWVTHDCFTMTYSINLSLIHHRLALSQLYINSTLQSHNWYRNKIKYRNKYYKI